MIAKSAPLCKCGSIVDGVVASKSAGARRSRQATACPFSKVEMSLDGEIFESGQDRPMKGMRLAGAKTMEPANGYLEKEYLPWWNRTRVGTWIGQEPKLRCRAWLSLSSRRSGKLFFLA